jgi:ABC-2 type transport system ATP-binding protein
MRIELCGVGKRYGKVLALADVTLTLPAGARVALVGPNGSGKTTLTRAIMGIVAHDGEVRIDGAPAFQARRELAQRLAYVPQAAPQMAAPVGELVRAVAEVRGLVPSAVADSAKSLDLDLGAIAPRPFRSLSGGMKQKLLLALAFASRPGLLVLDEPTASLDARARGQFFRLLGTQAPGVTLLLCSHRLEEIQHLVDHVIALSEGRVVYHGSAAGFLAERSAAVVALSVRGPSAEAWLVGQGFTRAAGGAWVRTTSGPAEKVALLGAAIQTLGADLHNAWVRDLDLVELAGLGEVKPGENPPHASRASHAKESGHAVG